MVYLKTFKIAFLLFPIVAFLITIPFILIEYHKYGSINKLRTLIIYSFILYLMTVYFLVILPLPSREEVASLTTPKYQLIPFKFIYDFFKETPLVWNNPATYLKAIKDASFYTVVFNILMTIPFGMYLRYYFQCDLKKTIKWSFALSLFFELTQATGLYFIYPRPYRLFDVDDLMMNTLGGILGYYLGSFLKFLPSRSSIDRHTKETAKMVSGLRRVTLFCLDFFLFNLIDGVCLLIVSNFSRSIILRRVISLIIFLTYYVLGPYLFDGKTIGSNFVHVKFKLSKRRGLSLLLKVFCEYSYYFLIPWGGFYFLFNGLSYGNIDIMGKVMIFIILGLIYIVIYVDNFIRLLKRHKMFYDKVSGVEFVSTIE